MAGSGVALIGIACPSACDGVAKRLIGWRGWSLRIVTAPSHPLHGRVDRMPASAHAALRVAPRARARVMVTCTASHRVGRPGPRTRARLRGVCKWGKWFSLIAPSDVLPLKSYRTRARLLEPSRLTNVCRRGFQMRVPLPHEPVPGGISLCHHSDPVRQQRHARRGLDEALLGDLRPQRVGQPCVWHGSDLKPSASWRRR